MVLREKIAREPTLASLYKSRSLVKHGTGRYRGWPRHFNPVVMRADQAAQGSSYWALQGGLDAQASNGELWENL